MFYASWYLMIWFRMAWFKEIVTNVWSQIHAHTGQWLQSDQVANNGWYWSLNSIWLCLLFVGNTGYRPWWSIHAGHPSTNATDPQLPLQLLTLQVCSAIQMWQLGLTRQYSYVESSLGCFHQHVGDMDNSCWQFLTVMLIHPWTGACNTIPSSILQ